MLRKLQWMACVLACAACTSLDERSFDGEQGTLPATPFDGASGGSGREPGDGSEVPGGGALQADRESIDFGPVALGVEAKASLRLINEGAPLAAAPSATLGGGTDFVIVRNLCASALATGESCDIVVGLRASDLGVRQATLSIDAGGDVIAVPLAALALRQSSLRIEPVAPATADFGALRLGESHEQSLRLTNGGGEPSGALTLGVAGDDFALIDSGGAGSCVSGSTSLAPAESCDVRVAFKPLEGGDRFGMFTVRTGEDAGSSLGLSGKGLAPALLAAAPREVVFGVVVRGSSAERFVEISNLGGEPSGPLAFSKEGPSADSVTWDAASCPEALEPGASCQLGLVFNPTEAGPHSARVTVTAQPGGSAVIGVLGTGVLPGALSIEPEAGGSADFGDVLQDASREQGFVVRNSGNRRSGPITIGVEGPGFSVAGGSCQSGVTDLASGANCRVRVRLTPGTRRGPLNGTLTVLSQAGGNGVSLEGRALAPATLVSPAGTQFDFGNLVQGQESTPFVWTLENRGDVASAVPEVTRIGADFRIVENGCTAAIEPGGSCTIRVAFAPTSPGSKNGSLSARAGGLQSTVLMTGSAQVRLTVQFAGAGSGQITSNPAGLDCTASAGCTALFSSVRVTLSARLNNGSDSLLTEWSNTTCTAPQRSCALDLTTSRTVTVTFSRVTNNIAFVSSVDVAANLGGFAPYDAHCNALATAAGINNAAGNAYLAAMGTTTVSLSSRFGNVQGWVRMDGRPFISSMADIFQRRVMHHPVSFDENGVAEDVHYMTGSSFDGALRQGPETCENWTSNFEATADIPMFPMVGSVFGGPDAWLDRAVGRCHELNRVLCMGRSRTAALTVPRATGRRIWVSRSGFVMGTSPDAHCQADRPAGVANAAALVAFTNRTAASVLDPAANYVRADGILVGTGAQIIAKQPLTGIWVDSSGQSARQYVGRVWSGASSMTTVGTAAATCNDWTSAAEGISGTVGFYDGGGARFWGEGPVPCSFGNSASTTPPRLYCVER